ncbi:MAG: hypothetical protein ACYTEU_13455 [Planctomycetota bacterium]|jgi:hypothetical protein
MKYMGFSVCGRGHGDQYKYDYQDILKPLESFLDQCWLYIGCAGMASSPYPLETIEDEQKWEEQYRKYVDSEHGYRIGKPGFWSFRGSGLDGRAIYYAIHSEKLPLDILNKLYDIEKYGVTLGDPNNWSLPEGVCMVFCDIDDCCLEVFVNESWMYDALEQYYKTNDLNAEVWKPEEMNDREDV